MVRKVAHEERLIDGHIFERLDALAFFELQHTVHQQKGVTVWQLLQDLMNIHAHFF
jgi:hypothetical protein